MTSSEDKRLSAQIILLSLIGVAFSVWIAEHHFSLKYDSASGPSFCSINATFDCDTIAKSSAAEWFGVPVAGFGVLFYLFLLASTWIFVPSNGYKVQQSRSVFFFLSAVSLVPSAYLLMVSAFVLHTFCPLCLVLDAVNVALFIVSYRSLAGSYSLLDSLIIGFETLLGSLAEALHLRNPEVPRRKSIQLILLVLIFGGVILFQLPAYFSRASSVSLNDDPFKKEVIQNFVYQWSRSPAQDISIDTAGDLKTRDFSLGPDNAPITIVTFSDFECPACKRMSGVMEGIVKKHPQTRLVFKNYPLDQSCNPAIQREIHKQACNAARMARCAGEQGVESFWAMHDALYSLSLFTEQQLAGLPKDLGLNVEAYESCMKSEYSQHRLDQDVAEGNLLRVDHTPSIFINGKLLSESSPEHLGYVVESLVAETKSGSAAAN